MRTAIDNGELTELIERYQYSQFGTSASEDILIARVFRPITSPLTSCPAARSSSAALPHTQESRSSFTRPLRLQSSAARSAHSPRGAGHRRGRLGCQPAPATDSLPEWSQTRHR